MHDKALEAAARAVCERKCFCAEVFGEPCIDPVTQQNAPCRATPAQLILSWRWEAAKNAVEAYREICGRRPLHSPFTLEGR